MKLFFFDLETTGLRFWKNGIHQISGAVKIGQQVKEYFNFNVRPYEEALIEQSALDVAGVTKEEVLAYPPMSEVLKEIRTILAKYVDLYDKKDKFFLAGYNNAGFDNPFFRAFFTQNEDEYFVSWFWSSPIDVFVLASYMLMNKRHKMPNFELHTVAREVGIEVDESRLHNAEYDIELTISIYDAFEKWIKYERMKSNAASKMDNFKKGKYA